MITYTKPETYLASGFFFPWIHRQSQNDTYVIIKYDLSDITNQTQKNWIQKQIEQNKHNISRLNNILIAYMENENWNS